MLYTTRILLPALLVSLLAACGGNDNTTPPTRVEGQETSPTLSAGSNQQAAERSTIELRATVQNTDQNSVVAYAWFPASEETVFFGNASIDVLAGNMAGVTTVAVAEFSNSRELRLLTADYYLSEWPAEI